MGLLLAGPEHRRSIHFGAADLARIVVPYGLVAALALALLAWRWSRRWLPAVAIVSVPFLVLHLSSTGGPGTYGHLGLDAARALLETLVWVAAAAILALGPSPLIGRLPVRVTRRPVNRTPSVNAP